MPLDPLSRRQLRFGAIMLGGAALAVLVVLLIQLYTHFSIETGVFFFGVFAGTAAMIWKLLTVQEPPKTPPEPRWPV
jgi:hypothetical protein